MHHLSKALEEKERRSSCLCTFKYKKIKKTNKKKLKNEKRDT